MFSRYAVYVVPDAEWGDFGAAWLGWDNRSGRKVPLLRPDFEDLTRRPRKYGFHATIKPPFRLAEGFREDDLAIAAEQFCAGQSPFSLSSLCLSRLGRLFALMAPGEASLLGALAGQTVRELDYFRAPMMDGDLARRRASGLSARQDALLMQWGYPFVMEEFRFHMTLTGPAKTPQTVAPVLEKLLVGLLQNGLVVDSLSLLGEAEDGQFCEIGRFPFLA